MIWVLVFIGAAVTGLCWLVVHWGHLHQDDVMQLRKQLNSNEGLVRTLTDLANRACDETINLKGHLDIRDKLVSTLEHDLIAAEKEIEILQVRQRSLEKKIIGGERTINLNIIDPKGKAKPLLDRAGVKTQ